MSIKKKFLVDIDLDNNQINNVAAPQVSGDVATYEWVTGLISAEEAARGASFSTVDGKIKDIISNLDITAVDSFTEVVTKINADITAEEARAIAAEGAEETRALAAEALIQADLDAEVSRIDSRDLATEVRIYNVEGSVTAEAATRAAADSAESAARIVADAGLQADVDAVTANVDAILLASDADKNSFAEIVTLINSVDTTNDEAFAGYVLSNNAAVAANAAAATADVDAEETRALAAEALIQADLDAEVSRIDSRDLATEVRIYNVEGSVTAEAATRAAADSALQNEIDLAESSINGETAARIAADSALQNEIDLAESSINGETAARIAADALLQADIDALDAAAIKTASNGLTEVDNNVKLGGELQDNTYILGYKEIHFGTEASNINRFGVKTDYGISINSNREITNTSGTSITDSSASRSITTTGGLGAVYGADYSATFVDNSLVSKLYVTNQIAAEAEIRLAADAGLQADVDAVTANVDAILLASDADKNSFAEIVTLINSVDTTNDEAFAGYVLLNNAAVAAEIANRAADVDAEEARGLAAEALLSGRITSEVADRAADVNAEETRATTAEDAEVARATAAEGVLQGNIDTLNSAAIKSASNGLTEVDNNVKLGGALLSGDTVFTGAAGEVEVKFGNSGGEISRFWIKATGEIYNVTEYGVITTSSEYGNINTTATRGDITTTATEGDITDSSKGRLITTSNGIGAVYGSDYSAGFVDNSLVSKLYVTNQIAAEAEIRLAADAGLQADVDAVTANVDAILLASDADKNSFAEIVTLINSVDTTNDEAFAGYVLLANAAATAEAATRAAADSAEETRALAAEALIQADLDAEVSRIDSRDLATEVRIYNVEGSVTAEAATRAAADSAESAARIAADGTLSDRITSEATTARAAEGVLTSNLDSAKTIIADRMNITPVVSSFTIGNGLTHSFVLEHSLGTTDVIIQVYNVATGQTVETSAIRVGLQTISIEFASAPALNSYKVVTMGIKAFAFSGL